MIEVTNLSKESEVFYVNHRNIISINDGRKSYRTGEVTSVITMVNNQKIIVEEPKEEIQKLIRKWEENVLAGVIQTERKRGDANG